MKNHESKQIQIQVTSPTTVVVTQMYCIQYDHAVVSVCMCPVFWVANSDFQLQ